MSGPGRARRGIEPLIVRIVGIEDRDAAGHEARKNLGLGVGDGLDRVEEFEMHRRDGGDDRDMRSRQRGQRQNLARVVHADLDDAEVRLARHPRQGQRHAPMIVVGSD